MYLTAVEYAQITGRDQAESTAARLNRACMLLDARIGHYERGSDGWKLDMDGLANYQKAAVREWVSQMVAFFVDNGDISPSAASVSLGRFSVTEHGQKGQVIPEEMNLADVMLNTAGIVNRSATLTHRAVDSDASEI